MMEAGWSARRIALQLGCSDCVVRRCWEQWIREMSFTRKLGSGRPPQTSCREDRRVVRNALVQPTTSSPPSSDESRFTLSSDDNRVRVGRPRGEHLNSTFASQQHTVPQLM
ncbi:transposable element Tcb2 transposase [Trichonephila clavipes]|nr:transposable element Tcb2 transposase [Trichonephila clavipes]